MISYQLRVTGDVTPDVLEELGDVRAASTTTSTLVSGVVPDQAALVGLLVRLRALDLDVTELRRLPPAEESPDEVEGPESP